MDSRRLFFRLALVGSVFAATVLGAFFVARQTGESSGAPALTPEALSQDDISQRFLPGSPWDGKGTGNATESDVAQVKGFPVLWLERSFAGYNLQAIYREGYTGPDGRTVNAVHLIYGTCVLTGEDRPSCSAPLQIRSEQCVVAPSGVAAGVVADAATTRGSASQVRFNDGHVTLWTANAMITVHAPGQPDLVDRAVAALQGFGAEAGLRSGEPLPTPNLAACPPPPK